MNASHALTRRHPTAYAILTFVVLIGAFLFVSSGSHDLKTSIQGSINARMAQIDQIAR